MQASIQIFSMLLFIFVVIFQSMISHENGGKGASLLGISCYCRDAIGDAFGGELGHKHDNEEREEIGGTRAQADHEVGNDTEHNADRDGPRKLCKDFRPKIGTHVILACCALLEYNHSLGGKEENDAKCGGKTLVH